VQQFVVSTLPASWCMSAHHAQHPVVMHAVGAPGQGYIWLAHRNIGDIAWDLAKHSKERWQAMLDEPHRGSTLSQAVQWQVGVCAARERAEFMLAACSMLFVNRRNAALQQANGSILLATDAAGVDALETRAAALHAQGIPSELLSAQQTMRAEPAVVLPTCGGGLLVPSDAQLVS
jgi:glycine/D-amino acid oxidase-like deaminating enzyme